MDNDVDLKYRNCKYFKENECKYRDGYALEWEPSQKY